MKRFILMLAALVGFASCSSTGDGDNADRYSRAVFAAAGALREIADSDPTLDADGRETLLATASVLSSAGHALRAYAAGTGDDAELLDQVKLGLYVLQQSMAALDQESYDRWRPYFVAAVAVLAIVEAELDPPLPLEEQKRMEVQGALSE